jgi:hypothetical protein
VRPRIVTISARAQEGVRRQHGLAQQPARIAAQVERTARGAFALVRDARRMAEDTARERREQHQHIAFHAPAHRLPADGVAGEGELPGAAVAHGDGHCVPGVPRIFSIVGERYAPLVVEARSGRPIAGLPWLPVFGMASTMRKALAGRDLSRPRPPLPRQASRSVP